MPAILLLAPPPIFLDDAASLLTFNTIYLPLPRLVHVVCERSLTTYLDEICQIDICAYGMNGRVMSGISVLTDFVTVLS